MKNRLAELGLTVAIAGAPALAPGLAFAQAAEHEGMPQLNFATPLTLSQVVWMAIIFFAMYLLLSRWALPQVASVIDARTASISGDLDAARAARTEADAAAREVAEATRRAQAESQAQIAEAVTAAKQQAAADAERANAALAKQLAAAEAQIAAAQASAMGALRTVAAETAGLVFSRLTGTSPDPQRLTTAVDAALARRS